MQYPSLALSIYILISMLRGFFLMPSTPFVLAGVAMYPDNPVLVISISLAGIMFSATLLYFFSKKFGFTAYIEKKHRSGLNATKKLLSGNRSTLFVAGWSFFPFVPTDLVCYAAGLIRMPFSKMMFGLFCGELLLVTMYVYMGKGFLAFF
jgi:uncharacterized membrane protein YdjX (TVP38/TMEM64 family)